MTSADLTRQVQQRNLKTLLETSAPFRKFCWTILNEAHIFYPTYSRVSPHDTSHNEGRRALGLEVLHILKNAYPGVLGLLEREGNLLSETQPKPPNESEDEDEEPHLPDVDDDER